MDDNRIPILRSCAVTTARDHDTAIDLSKKGITVYRNKGCFGHDPGGINGTMDRAVRGHKLPIESVRRNLRISRKRSMVECPYAVMKRVFHFSNVLVTLIRRVGVKFMFTCFAYNLHAVKIMQG